MSDDTSDQYQDIPTLDELINTVSASDLHDHTADDSYEINYEDYFKHQSPEIEAGYIHLKGLQDHYLHKNYWSIFLMVILGSMMGFQIILLTFVGLGKFDFSHYEWLLPALLVQNLAQVLGLAVIAVTSLFKRLTKEYS